MTEVNGPVRLAKAAKDLNVGITTVIEHLKKKGFDVENKPTTKLSEEMYSMLLKDFREEIVKREEADQVNLGGKGRRDNIEIEAGGSIAPPKKEEDTKEVYIKSSHTPSLKEEVVEQEPEIRIKGKIEGPKIVGKVDLEPKKKPLEKKIEKPKEPEPPKVQETKPEPVKPTEEIKETPVQKKGAEKEPDPEVLLEKTKLERLQGPTVIGKINLPVDDKKKREKKEGEPDAAGDAGREKRRRKRRRITKTDKIDLKSPGRTDGKKVEKTYKTEEERAEVSEKEIQEKIKATMAKISGLSKGKSTRSKHRRTKREDAAERASEEVVETNKLQLTEFISVSELGSLMNVAPHEVISKCMSLGIIVSINQRLDAEVIELVADEFGFEVSFIEMMDEEIEDEREEDKPEDLTERAPIVTIMGHVDHGKTSLLDYIRKANVVAGEKGGITQHIGAYEVTTENGKNITFLDTPGHEAFTAMRARGAKITDIAVIVIAADDQVMPQTKEAISHAQAAGVPMIFAFNKIDKEGANPEKIKEQLSGMNILVEDWGGKYQAQEISAKSGLNVDNLLEKILLESELLELKANEHKRAIGTVLEASLDKGRGYVTTVLVQEGTLEIGDMVLAGPSYGRVKAMFNERNQRIFKAGPSQPALILGMNGAPQAGESMKVMTSEQEVKSIATKRMQIMREQGIRTKKHITLDEIGRRLALGTFKELNIIIKADFDGSAEALSDSLQKISSREVQINIVHKGVGQITESDVLLASASDAIIIGFQVRPSVSARRIAENENIDIRLYSVIYDAINEVKSAMEGMLEPKIEEKITGNIEVRETFKITKVGTIAGCYVVEGKVSRSNKVRIVRDGIVVYTGELASLKRYKDDVKEVAFGMECGLNIKDYNDIKVGDIIESFEEVEVKRKLTAV